MKTNIEDWLNDREYDISNLTDSEWEILEDNVEDIENDIISDREDEIGEEIVARFKLKKLKKYWRTG